MIYTKSIIWILSIEISFIIIQCRFLNKIKCKTFFGVIKVNPKDIPFPDPLLSWIPVHFVFSSKSSQYRWSAALALILSADCKGSGVNCAGVGCLDRADCRIVVIHHPSTHHRSNLKAVRRFFFFFKAIIEKKGCQRIYSRSDIKMDLKGCLIEGQMDKGQRKHW